MNRHQLACEQIWGKLDEVKNEKGDDYFDESHYYEIEQILQQTEGLVQEDLEAMSKENKHV